MYPFAPTAERTREIWIDTKNSVAGLVPPGGVQEGTILAFLPLNNVSRNARIKLSSNDDKAVTPIQQLLPNMRLCNLFSLGLGICKVPVSNGVDQWGNAEFTSDPYSALFTSGEQAALRHLFLSNLTFETNQTKRMDALHTSEFNIVTTEASANSIKPRLLTASYVLVGGEPNVIELMMPEVGDLAVLADSGTRKLFICAKAQVINIVPSSDAQKQSIAQKLRGGI